MKIISILVELLRRYSNRPDLLGPLVSALKKINNPTDNGDETVTSAQGQTAAVWRVSDRLSDGDVAELLEAYRGGTTAKALAKQYELHASSVKRVLRRHEVRRH